MKNTRASRKAKRIAETIKELSDCKQALKLSQKAINESWLIDRISREIAMHLASNLKIIVRN